MLGYGGPKPGRGGGGAPPPPVGGGGDFTYRPGGATIGRTFASWPALHAAYTAAIAAGERGVDIIFDTSIVYPVPALIGPVGVYAIDNTTTLRGRFSSPVPDTAVDIADGVTLPGLSRIDDFLILASLSSAPVASLAGVAYVDLDHGSAFRADGAAPFFTLLAGATPKFQLYRDSQFRGPASGGVSAIVDLPVVGTAATIRVYEGSTVEASTISGVLGSFLALEYGDENGFFIDTTTGLPDQPGFAGTMSQDRLSQDAHTKYVHTAASVSFYTVRIDDSTVLADAVGGPVSVTLPPITAFSDGREIVVKKVDASGSLVSVVGFGGDLVDGVATQFLFLQYESITIRANAAIGEWNIV